MIPVVIGSPGGDCFAMYGPGSGPAVLICPPFGDEALKTARVWRDLAVRLGEHGLATLRFDLPGTGNSAGEPTDPNQVDIWRGSLRCCADWLAARHDGRIVLFGHRFGALLALDATASGTRAERLVLLDPPASGASLGRYLRARARLEQTGPLPEGAQYLQAGGVPLSKATFDALATLPAELTGVSVPPALLVLPETIAPTPWPECLQAHGSKVETITFEGHADFVLHDVFRAKTPTKVLDRIVDYLVQTAGPMPRPRHETLPVAELRSETFMEMPVRFGADHRMFGILCRPVSDAPTLRAVLLPTTGADPCSGMARMWTDLARSLARQGVVSLRFDMRGVGESDGRRGHNLLATMYSADRFDDVRSAIDALAELGFKDVNVIGYCAGAYAAWHTATIDDRIASLFTGNLLYLNQQSNPTEDVLQLQPGSSLLGLNGGVSSRMLPAAGLSTLRRLDDRTRAIVPRRLRHFLRAYETEPRQVRRHVQALVARQCSVSLVMADGDHGHIRLRRAYGETPRLPKGVELTVIADADHQFSNRQHRAQFLELAASFALRHSVPPPTTHAPREPARVLEIAS